MKNTTLPTLDEWDQLSLYECEDAVRAIVKRLPSSFRYRKLERFQLGNILHRIAFFEWKPLPNSPTGIFFAFLPGGRTTLGYDKNKPFSPSSLQLKSWQEETLESGLTPHSLKEHLEKMLSPFRVVELQPILFQMVASNRTKPPRFEEKSMKRRNSTHRADVLTLLDNEGFRLPSLDEWEYACGAGANTLFRWGNDTPMSSLRFSYPAVHIPGEWDFHLRPNAFGLFIGNDPYKWEFCAEPEYMKGGDGGNATHAGAGSFAEWLVFATSFYYKFNVPEESVYGAHFRRVYTLE